jgi:regulator of protease activity HflC (stomatin/prohibitin superfamily)
MLKEREISTVSGGLILLAFLLVLAGIVAWLVTSIQAQNIVFTVVGVLALVANSVLIAGVFMVNPNEAKVLQLFGRYAGTAKQAGLRWANPFYSKRAISLRVRNFESERLKVNDLDGNPIEIAAVVVWKVVDTAEALFQVDNYEQFVHVQSESALRSLATGYSYDSQDDKAHSLRGNAAHVTDHLRHEIQERLAQAGVEVTEARISHLAYAPEIAQAMLQRQQASAIIAARSKIVEGAVGMVEMALDLLSKHKVVELDEERRAAMVSNLLVVLCGERNVQPVVNTGTLYT